MKVYRIYKSFIGRHPFISILLFILPFVLYTIYKSNSLDNNFLVSQGYVTKVEFLRGGDGYFVNFTFPEGGSHKSSIPYVKYDDIYFLKTLLIDKNMPVIYDKGDHDNCEMLFMTKQFKKYKIPLSQEQQLIAEQIDSLEKTY